MAQSNNKSSSPQRVMIIVWKWKKSNLENGGKWTTDHIPQPNDCIYCLSDKDTFKTRFDKIMDIASACTPDAQVYIFWHRTSSYDSKSVGEILEKFNTDHPKQKAKCFLFGQGSDFIYIAINEKGLLATDGLRGEGSFGGLKENGNKMIQVITDEVNRKINYLHFENIWNYYSHLFKARIFDLKEDLFLYFHNYWLEKEDKEQVVLFDLLRKNEDLHRRLSAFVNGLNEEEYEKAEKAGLNNELFLMDNCLPNLQSIYGTRVAEAYLLLAQMIKENILDVPVFTGIRIQPSGTLNDLRRHFKVLLHAMPEESYY